MDKQININDVYAIVGKQTIQIEVLSAQLQEANQKIKELSEGKNGAK